MFRKIRRTKSEISVEEAKILLKNNKRAAFSVNGDNGYPFTIPINFYYDENENKIYFHSAKSGHKIDAIKAHCKASFCVIDQDEIIPSEYTTYFRSVIAFGTIRILHDSEQKRTAIEKLTQKYVPNGGISNRKQAIDQEWEGLCMLEMAIKHLTGKEAIELAKRKTKPGV